MKRPLCRNCGHTIEGNYCSHCGQRTNVERLTWTSLGESFTSTFIGDEAFGIKGVNMRRGMFMTWVLILLHPVTSIKEYLAGCQHKYFNPVAILLMLSTLYALLYSWVDNSYTPTADFETQHWAIFLIRSFIDYAKIHPAAYTLASLPMFALALRTVFRHKLRLRYIEYLYVGIFISIFEISLMTAMLPVEAYRPDISHWKLVTLPAFIYTAIAYYRLFALRTVKGAVIRTALTSLLHTLYIILVITVALLIVVAYVALHPDKINNTRKGSGIELFDHGKQSFMEGLTELSFEAETDTKADTSASDDKIDSLITDFKRRIHEVNSDGE